MVTNPLRNLRFRIIRKLTLFVLLAAVSGITATAQDLLKLKNGKELKVTVVEEGTAVIKYREFEDPTGPVYSIGMDKVESIKYKKGSKPVQGAVTGKEEAANAATKDSTAQEGLLTAEKRSIYLDGKVQSPRSIRLLMEDQPEALKEYEKAKKMFVRSNTCPFVIMGISLLASSSMQGMEEQSERLKVGIPVLCLDGVLIVAGIIFAKNGKKALKNSATLYNSSVTGPARYSLNFGIQQNGIGVSLRF